MQHGQFIKRSLGVLAAMVCLGGCGSDDRPAPAAPEPAKAPASLEVGQWLLSYEARCESVSPSNCKGAYGFSVKSDGAYRIGPAPGQQLVTGRISEEELKSLDDHLSSVPAVDGNTARCPSLRLLSRGLERCLNDGQVLSIVQSLVAKYHPETFPNPCIGAATALEKEYASIRSCQHDMDCAYLDSEFLPVEGDSVTDVWVDDCSYIRPLPVGNSFSAVSNQLKLLIQKDIALQVCGDSVIKPACSHLTGFDPRGSKPVCLSGSCAIPTSVQIR